MYNVPASGELFMLRMSDEAPNFTAETSQGMIDFHEWIGNGWVISFSHPRDFTRVRTTVGIGRRSQARIPRRLKGPQTIPADSSPTEVSACN
jgi:hypothetical protein